MQHDKCCKNVFWSDRVSVVFRNFYHLEGALFLCCSKGGAATLPVQMREILWDVFAEGIPYLSSVSFLLVFIQGVKVSFWNKCLQEAPVKVEHSVCLQKQNFLNVWLLLEVATYSFGCLIKWFGKVFLDFSFPLISIFSRLWSCIINVRSIIYLPNWVFLQNRLFFYLANNIPQSVGWNIKVTVHKF